MAVGVVDLLEVVEVNKDHRKFVVVPRRAIDLGLQNFIEMAGVVEAGAIVGDGEFLNLLDGARVFNGDGGVVAECVQEEHFAFGVVVQRHVHQLDHA